MSTQPSTGRGAPTADYFQGTIFGMQHRSIEHLVGQIDDRDQRTAVHTFKSAYRLFRDKQRALEVACDQLIENRPDLSPKTAAAALQLILKWRGVDG